MKELLIFLLVFLSSACFAYEPLGEKGFHWYSTDDETEEQVQRAPSSNQSPSANQSMFDKLMQMRKEAKESLARALIEPTVENTTEYMRRQKEFVDLSTQFVRNWKIALLLHPELDYSLEQPVDNNAIAMRNDAKALLIDKVIRLSTKNYGLLFFYRGKSELSQRFSTNLLSFVESKGIQMVSATTDDVVIEGLPNSYKVPQQRAEAVLNIKPNYQPALYLINLKSKEVKPLSFGYVSISELKSRYFDVLTNFSSLTSKGDE